MLKMMVVCALIILIHFWVLCSTIPFFVFTLASLISISLRTNNVSLLHKGYTQLMSLSLKEIWLRRVVS